MKEKILVRLASFLSAVALWSFMTAASAQTTVEYIHTDALGTPVAVTDAVGVVVERSEYEPFGQLVNRPLTDGPGFTGHVQDAATGLTYMQQRYYDPLIGRFLSVDPVTAYSMPGANFNRYWYANNNPYAFTDPDGRLAQDDKPPQPSKPVPPPPAPPPPPPPITTEERIVVRPEPSLLGKIAAGSTTVFGINYGFAGYLHGHFMGTDPEITFGNNAIQFVNVPSHYMPTAMTLGNTITYGKKYPPDKLMRRTGNVLGTEEMQHTLQAEMLGSMYLPMHIYFGTKAAIINGEWHGYENIFERNPHSKNPRP